ncbi:hypothetical protein QJS04_geneDACA007150 [Acorus gramineus]|uniref:PHD and RING finger domain-containing protein 1 n=1 Tax=Acorus gramineus TaxID=55184 RepID=A0AAV9BP11_ACOGR|nr:hypothetical protein QJS04_geneDACA007150 [Acorus gramineus]
MARGVKKRRGFRSKERGSDDSEDEEYVLEEEPEEEEEEEDFVSSSEEENLEFSDEDVLDDEEEVVPAVRSRSKGPAVRKPVDRKGRRRKITCSDDDDDDDFDDEDFEPESDDLVDEKKGARTAGRGRGRRRKAAPPPRKTSKAKRGRVAAKKAVRKKRRKRRPVVKSPPVSSDDDFVVMESAAPQGELGKQVCGICLSEERKGTVRGILNSCMHYFCFACIMEWSKVESRCPVCKRRFATISKSARSDGGIGLRKAVIRVPKRDQVYHPSEEEIRGYMDPYENAVCMECHQGGDDNLMLLCDICDSSAHTYCVGLGREVPEGDWFCSGCRPAHHGSSSSQIHDSARDQVTNDGGFCNEHVLVRSDGENFDVNRTFQLNPCQSASLQEHSPFQGTSALASPRYPGGDLRATPQASGTSALTVSARRAIQHRIRILISNSWTRQNPPVVNRTDDSWTGELISEDPGRENRGPSSSAFGVRVQGSDLLNERPSYSGQREGGFGVRNYPVRETNHGPNTSFNSTTGECLQAELDGMSSSQVMLADDQHYDLNQPIFGSPFTYDERNSFHPVEGVKEQVQSVVRRQMKHMSKESLGVDMNHM